MVIVHKFDRPNAAGGDQFVAHKVTVSGSPKRYSVWFSRAGLVDAEGFDRLDRAIGVRRGTPLWAALEARVPSLILFHDQASGS